MKLVDIWNIDEIVGRDNLNGHAKIEDGHPVEENVHVHTDYIPVDVSALKNVRITKVDAGTKVPKHSHAVPVFRYITKGEAVVNGKRYKEEDWMVIPANHEYEVTTEKGYTALWVYIKCINN